MSPKYFRCAYIVYSQLKTQQLRIRFVSHLLIRCVLHNVIMLLMLLLCNLPVWVTKYLQRDNPDMILIRQGITYSGKCI